MRYLLIVLLVLLYTGCTISSTEDITPVKEFPINKELTATIIEIPPVLLNSRNLIITGDDRLISYEELQDSFFVSFRLPGLEYLGKAGTKGQGPDEFLNPDERSFTGTRNGFYVLDVDDNRLKEAEWTDGQFSLIRSDKIAEPYPAINCFVKINDNTACILDQPGKDTEYQLIDLNTFETKDISPYPNLTEVNLDDPHKKWFAYIKNNVAKPDGSKFASFYCYFKFFRIYDSQGNILKNISVEIEPFKNTFKDDFEESLMMYASYPKATEKHIYVLCRNKKDSDIPNADSVELQVWDWDGNPVARYILNNTLNVFAISEKYNKLYAVHRDTEDKIFVYDLQ